MTPPLVLASRSPQRRAILEQLGVEFRVVAPDVEEVAAGAPADVVVENALRKARAVASRLAGDAGTGGDSPAACAVDPDSGGKPHMREGGHEAGGPPPPDGGGEGLPATRVLGVDTAVVAGGRIYGKPRDEREARSFLETLSGRDHAVWSGLAVIALDSAGGRAGSPPTASACTTVRFRPLDSAELEWYLASGEWRERAGGYAIQGRGAALVERIEGDYSTVVGLPVPDLVRAAPDLFAD